MKPFMIATALAMLATPTYATPKDCTQFWDAEGAECKRVGIKSFLKTHPEYKELPATRQSKPKRKDAETDKKCIADIQEDLGFDLMQAKRACNSKNYVKPDELGWSCELEGGKIKIYKDKGGARLKRDAICG